MPLIIPPHIAGAGFAGAPAKYPWNAKIGLALYGSADENPRLYRAIDEADFRSKMGLGVALTEWIVWRMSGLTDVADALLRVEAGWAMIARPQIADALRYVLGSANRLDAVVRPVEQAMANLDDMAKRYAEGDIYLAEIVVRQAKLARHVAPNKDLFDAWLSTTVRDMAAKRPRNAEYDESTGLFDASQEALVSRDSFGDTFVENAATAQALDAFMKSLDPAANPYITV